MGILSSIEMINKSYLSFIILSHLLFFLSEPFEEYLIMPVLLHWACSARLIHPKCPPSIWLRLFVPHFVKTMSTHEQKAVFV